MRGVVKPYYSHNDITLFHGNALDVLAEMEPESVHCCVTSPPYFSLRDYGVAGQIGLEDTPDEYIGKLVEVFREVRRVLRDDGTLWLNVGDSYAANRPGGQPIPTNTRNKNGHYGVTKVPDGLKPKDLIGIPWMLVFALRADGWWLRSEITWCKKAPMPESVTDRPTSATEKLFLLAKSPKYFYDHVAVRVPSVSPEQERHNQKYAKVYEVSDNNAQFKQPNNTNHLGIHSRPGPGGRNLWNYWLLGPEPSSIPHYATFPTKLVEPCILAGCPEGGIVLDPFCGVGTTGVVSIRHRRKFVGIDLKREYLDLAIENMDGRPIRLPLEVS